RLAAWSYEADPYQIYRPGCIGGIGMCSPIAAILAIAGALAARHRLQVRRLGDARVGLGQLADAAVPGGANRAGTLPAAVAVLDVVLLCRRGDRVSGRGSRVAQARLAGAFAGRADDCGADTGLGRPRAALSGAAFLAARSRAAQIPGQSCHPGFGA